MLDIVVLVGLGILVVAVVLASICANRHSTPSQSAIEYINRQHEYQRNQADEYTRMMNVSYLQQIQLQQDLIGGYRRRLHQVPVFLLGQQERKDQQQERMEQQQERKEQQQERKAQQKERKEQQHERKERRLTALGILQETSLYSCSIGSMYSKNL